MMKLQDSNVFTGKSYQTLNKEKMLTFVALPESRKRLNSSLSDAGINFTLTPNKNSTVGPPYLQEYVPSPQWMPETTDSTKLYICSVFPIYTHL